MEKIKISWAHRILKIFKWAFLVLLALYIIAVVVRVFQLRDLAKTNAEVAKIHATKLTLDDVMGKNLPPDPGALAGQTVQGVDVNNNGIRDDVELAVFKAYPNSAKTRAVLLQYALALQMETIQPIVNTVTVTEVIREEDRADSCLADTLVPRKTPESSRSSDDMKKIDVFEKFVEGKQLNTQERKNYQESFYKNIRSYNSLPITCDVDYSTLPN